MVNGEFDLEEHRRIYAFILTNPGIHLRRLARDLNVNLSTLRYRLDTWEKQGLIVSRKEQNLKVYFVSDRLSTDDKAITHLLQQKRFRDIILTILINPGATHAKLMGKLDLKPSTLTKYIKVIEKEGLVRHERQGREKHYHLNDEENLTRMLLSYRRSFWDSFVDSVLEIYFER